MTKSRTRSAPPAAGCTWSSSDRPQAKSLRVVRTAPAQAMTAAQAANTRPPSQGGSRTPARLAWASPSAATPGRQAVTEPSAVMRDRSGSATYSYSISQGGGAAAVS